MKCTRVEGEMVYKNDFKLLFDHSFLPEDPLEKNLATVCQDLPSLSKSCQDFVRS